MVNKFFKVGSLIGALLLTLFLLLLLITPPSRGFSVPKTSVVKRSPVILVPGDGGSQLEAKLDRAETPHYFCSKTTTDYISLWVNLELLLPYFLDCWVENMRLVYDNVTRTTTNTPGVSIRVPGFGNTTTVEYLDESQISPSAYFLSIVEALVEIGYKRAVDIRGAPYDYRKAPNEMSEYYKAIKSMSEEMYVKSNKTRITYICHSMGCPVMLYFFNQQSQQWKDAHVKALVSLGGAWAGAVKALKAFASGENLGIYVINHLSVRKEQRSCPSLAYMVPFDNFWNRSEVLVETPLKNYTVGNFYDFFNDIGFPDGYEIYKDTYNLTRTLIPPGVDVHCLHGVGEETIERLVYKNKEFPDSNPSLVYGDGDGTVNVRSLEGCLRFQRNGNKEHKVFHIPLKNVDHMGILFDKQAIDHIKAVVTTF